MEGYVDFTDGVITSIDKNFNKILVLTKIYGEDIYEIGNSACKNGAIRGLDISQTKISILRESSFCYCFSLSSVKLPETITTLCGNAFAHCNFSEIRIPKNLVSLNGWSFNQASNIEKFEVDEENEAFTSINGIILDKKLTTIVVAPRFIQQDLIPTYSSITKIGELAFITSRITRYNLNLNITGIGEHAFTGSKLKKIDLRRTSLLSLPNHCFWSCSYLTDIYLPETIKTINYNALTSTRISYISFPPSISTINNEAICNCAHLKAIIYFGETDFSNQNFLTKSNSFVTPKVYVTNSYPSNQFGGFTVTIGAYQFGLSRMKCSMKITKNSKISLVQTAIILLTK